MTEDRHHNPDIQRLEQLYHQAADAEPLRDVDNAVLTQAHRAASGSRRLALRHPGAWGAGLAAAASLVLAVGLVFQYGWQPAPESERLRQFRARAEMEQADKPSAPAAGDGIKRQDGGEPMAIEESAELNRVQVTGARNRQESAREEQKSRESERDEVRLAAPVPTTEDEQLGPEEWLERIRGLAEAGKMDSAREELRAFREIHPDVEVSQDIQALLEDEAH